MFNQIPTLAEVCSAIAEGHLAATTDGRAYEVNAFELRRYFTRHHVIPLLTFAQLLSFRGFERRKPYPPLSYNLGF